MNRFSTILGLFCAFCLATLAQGAFDEPFQNGTFDADLSGWSLYPSPPGEAAHCKVAEFDRRGA